MESLDYLTSRAVYAARNLERALHAPDGWTIECGPHVVQATRQVFPEGVHLSAVVPQTCWLDRPGSIVLRHDGEVVSVRAIDHPGDVAFGVTWTFAARVKADLTR